LPPNLFQVISNLAKKDPNIAKELRIMYQEAISQEKMPLS